MNPDLDPDNAPIAPLAAVRETPDQAAGDEWALVLAAAGIAYRIQATGRGSEHRYLLAVGEGDRLAAARALDAYDAETRGPEAAARQAAAAASSSWEGRSTLGVVVAAVLLGFHLLAGARDGGEPSRWFQVGAAASDAILRGELWRAVTAMTLHADLLHLFGNAVASLIFVGAAGRWLGGGLAAALTIAAGAAANLLTAAAHGPGHLSVGASTATFAALGIMAGLQVVRHFRIGPLKRRAWLPIGAGIALFAMLGVGERADVGAHIFGLGCGCVLGLAAALLLRRRPGAIAQALLAAASAATVAGAWLLAFRG